MIVEVCIGSSCHIKGSHEIVEMLKTAIAVQGLEDEVVLAGSFCKNKCNRTGVTITVDDKTVTGVTKDNFNEFFKNEILNNLENRE